MPKIGKIDLQTFEQFLMKKLGKENKKVIVPPQTGVDAAVIDVGNENVLIIAEDPIFPMPGESFDGFGWYIVHIGASDVAVMGVKPEYMAYSLLMPPGTSNADLQAIVTSIHRTAQALDIAIVGGHTGYYPAVNTPIIGGVTVLAVAHKDRYVTPQGATAGDKIILTKGPAIEATGILATIYEEQLLQHFPSEMVKRAKSHMRNMTVVHDALVAMSCGGVTAMHDATEGGVIGGLFEIAHASDVGMQVDEKKMVYPKEMKEIMEYLDIDPLAAISEGSLIVTASPEKADTIVKTLASEGIPSSVIGEVTHPGEGRYITRLDGRRQALHIPEQDPFWPSFFKGLNSEQ